MRKTNKVYDREASCERLKKAAVEIFSEKGFSETTTRMIAKRSEVNLALINRYFGSKEKLMLAVINDEVCRVTKEELGYPAKSSLVEELRGYLQHHSADMERRLPFIRIVTHQALTDPKFREILEEMMTKGDHRLLARIEKLVSKKSRAVDICRATSIFLRGQLFGRLLTDEPRWRQESESFLAMVTK